MALAFLQDTFPAGVTKFVKIASTRSEMIALGDNGFFYGWQWKNDELGSMTKHHYSVKLLSDVSDYMKSVLSL